MQRPAIIAFVAALGALAIEPAAAAELGVYAGGFYGQTDKDADQAVFAAQALFIYDQVGFTPQSTSSTFDTEDTSYGFVVGYRLSSHFAIEGGYLSLGTVSYRDRSTGIADGETLMALQNIESDTSGIQVSALGILPVNYRWEVYGRAGVLVASNEVTVFISDGVVSDGAQGNKSGFDFLAGVGASFTFAEIYGLRLEYQRVFDAGEDATLAEADVDLLSVGFTVSF